MRFCWYWLLFLSVVSGAVSGGTLYGEVSTGTLIVSYQTGPKEERLDRVRFRIENEHLEQKLYPKASLGCSNESGTFRTVVINDLPVGKYTIQFLIPNSDALFEEVAPRFVELHAGEVLKVNHTFKPRYASLKAVAEVSKGARKFDELPTITLRDQYKDVRAQSTLGKLAVHYLQPGKYTVIFESLPGYTAPEKASLILQPNERVDTLLGIYKSPANDPLLAESGSDKPQVGQLQVQSNLPEAHWLLYRADVPVYRGKGSESKLFFPIGKRYRLRVDDVEGYGVSVSEKGEFAISTQGRRSISINYVAAFGYINIKTALPVGQVLNVKITSKHKREALQISLAGSKGGIDWKSPPLPTGEYVVVLESTAPSFAPESREVMVSSQRVSLISLEQKRGITLTVETNLDKGAFQLHSLEDGQKWQGTGSKYVFGGLVPGSYQLSFMDTMPGSYLPPAEERINLFEGGDVNVKAFYRAAGTIRLSADSAAAQFHIVSVGGKAWDMHSQLSGKEQSFVLPIGTYRLLLDGEKGSTAGKQFEVEQGKVLSLALASPSRGNGYLKVHSGLAGGKYRLRPVSARDASTDIYWEGDGSWITLDPNVKYSFTAAPVPNFTYNPVRMIEVKGGERKEVELVYRPQLSWSSVPEGISQVGDSFSDSSPNTMPAKSVRLSSFAVATYPTTNAQYAQWLTRAYKEGKVLGGKEGALAELYDREGHLLFKTLQGTNFSQIEVRQELGKVKFVASPGKEDFPVICVSWYGAALYAEDNGFRLPTEAEWEKSASVEVQAGKIRKFRYGFSRDEIDPTWANYKSISTRVDTMTVNTSPIGFYNGFNMLPVVGEEKPIRTSLARSPYGAYDMSGNVWEWVSDWYASDYTSKMPQIDPKGPSQGSEKVAKGGCYDSTAEGVRVAERLSMPPQYLDAFTGFRLAK